MLPPPSAVVFVAPDRVVPFGPLRRRTVDLYSSQSPLRNTKPPFLAQKKNQIEASTRPTERRAKSARIPLLFMASGGMVPAPGSTPLDDEDGSFLRSRVPISCGENVEDGRVKRLKKDGGLKDSRSDRESEER